LPLAAALKRERNCRYRVCLDAALSIPRLVGLARVTPDSPNAAVTSDSETRNPARYDEQNERLPPVPNQRRESACREIRIRVARVCAGAGL